MGHPVYTYPLLSPIHSLLLLPALCNVCTFQVAICISLILFHCIGWFYSNCSEATIWVSYLSFFMVTGCQAVAHPQPAEPVHHICNTRQSDPAIPPGTGHPFWSHFTACMGCSGTILFPSHPPHRECITYIHNYFSVGKVLSVTSHSLQQCNPDLSQKVDRVSIIYKCILQLSIYSSDGWRNKSRPSHHIHQN